MPEGFGSAELYGRCFRNKEIISFESAGDFFCFEDEVDILACDAFSAIETPSSSKQNLAAVQYDTKGNVRSAAISPKICEGI